MGMWFLGDSATMAVSAAKYFSQGKPNTIYYTDDYIDLVSPFGPQDNVIFYLDGDTGASAFGQHYPFQSSHSRLPPYIWILPPIGYLLHRAEPLYEAKRQLPQAPQNWK
ncbi:unnamed protein product [Cuscuta epithymum]|uniref:DUF295 domain-containing protein n=1 Tax=Cuscuta epithymum TaxID=186058 RepID=A0AAV0FCH5_9ASTE|nr:unnamed protein product [Cuscuta epithymum]